MDALEKKNFGLTEKSFNDLRQQLVEGNEKLFEHIFLLHFQDCRRFLMQADQAPEDLAYDATMDAFLTFRQKLVEKKISYGNLRFLLTRMARQHYYKQSSKETDFSINPSNTPDLVEETPIEPEIMHIFERGWELLGKKCQKLLRSFYFHEIPLKRLAETAAKTPEALRKQKQRCVDQLRSIMVDLS